MADDKHIYPSDDAEGTATDSAAPLDEITRLRQELQEARDGNLRTVAEMQNQQRRAVSLNGTVAWLSGPAGTVFTLSLPLKAA